MSAETVRLPHAVALLLESADRLVVGTVRDVHRAVARRAFTANRMAGFTAPERVHDQVSDAVYGGLSSLCEVGSRAARELASRGVGPPLERHAAGRTMVAAVNGLIGDELRRDDDPHAVTMAVRHDGEDLAISPYSVGQRFRGAGGHLVVFLHGLCESDDSWQLRRAKVGSTYPQRIAAETDGVPVVLRYNTGLHISENGVHLAAILHQLMEAWPVPVTRISFVGHSMGGLVARAAIAHGLAHRQIWPGLTTTVVCLGTPHTGAPLEKAVFVGSHLLRMTPYTAPFSAVLDTRSGGIHDLRHGYIDAADWYGRDLTRQWGYDRQAAAPLPHATFHFVAATLGQGLRSPLGDWFVTYHSAIGSTKTGSVVEGATHVHNPGVDHFALLNHPEVGDHLVTWLNARHRRPAALPPSPTGENP